MRASPQGRPGVFGSRGRVRLTRMCVQPLGEHLCHFWGHQLSPPELCAPSMCPRTQLWAVSLGRLPLKLELQTPNIWGKPLYVHQLGFSEKPLDGGPSWRSHVARGGPSQRSHVTGSFSEKPRDGGPSRRSHVMGSLHWSSLCSVACGGVTTRAAVLQLDLR